MFGRGQFLKVLECPAKLTDLDLLKESYDQPRQHITHSSVLVWRIPGMGEPVGLPSMGSHRVGHDWSDLAAAATNFYSLKIKKISAGRLALGDWLGCYRCLLGWASLPTWESGSLLVMVGGFWQWLQRGSISFRGVLGSGPPFCGLATRPLTCGLGRTQRSVEETATHSNLTWEIPWTEEHGWLQSMGLQRVGPDLVT